MCWETLQPFHVYDALLIGQVCNVVEKEKLDYSWNCIQPTYNSASASLLGTDLQECFESMVAYGWCEINRKLGQNA